MVESAGNAPTWACLQGKCISCLPRPRNGNWQAALVLPQASWVLETLLHELVRGFPECGIRNAECGIVRGSARQVHSAFRTLHSELKWCGCRELHPDILRGGETFSSVKSQPQESKRAGSVFGSHSRPAPFQQRTNTSCYLAIPTHGFTVVLSVFGGTPPAKPLKCKIRPNSSGALVGDPWANPTGGEPRLSRALLCFVPGDII